MSADFNQPLTSNDRTKVPQGLDFSALILGFSGAALSYMGFSIGGHDKPIMNQALAKQNIDTIKMLKEKSQGNLSTDELDLINQVLRDLMVKFAEAFRANSDK